ncbi:ABC transporter substrate-binding protein (plasmid) [Rhizobium sp. NIBRBAC000502774]|nr:ABC transporter substrate-binding protein [Rhizobium sp. NIBRBAC000502774]
MRKLTAIIALGLVAGFAPLCQQAIAQETRTITDLVGTVEVPVDPQRIVVTDGDFILQPTVALGLKPVGASRPSGTGAYSSVVSERISPEMGYIGEQRNPSFEDILMMEPDLILMSNDDVPDQKGMYERFSAIAPTVLIDREQLVWKQTLRDIGAATGRSAQAEDLLALYEKRVAEVRAVVGDRAGIASVPRIRPDHVRYMLQDNSFIWDVLKSVGFRASDKQQKSGDVPFVRLNLESLDVLDADLILVLEDPGAQGAGGMIEQVNGLPAYKALTANRLTLSSSEYLFGNVLTALELLDLIEAHYKKG